LFNHGFFWEAHEAWEELWLEAKHQPTTALWIKGLIKLAAAGVKALESQPEGVRRHARRASEIFYETRLGLPELMCGLDTASLEHWAQAIALAPEDAIASAQDQRRLLGRLLELSDEQRSA
jgi:hypothetical protein